MNGFLQPEPHELFPSVGSRQSRRGELPPGAASLYIQSLIIFPLSFSAKLVAHTYLPTYLPACLPVCLPACLPGSGDSHFPHPVTQAANFPHSVLGRDTRE